MTYDILIQPLSTTHYQATVLGWPELQAVGEDETHVLEQIRTMLQKRLAQSKVVRLDVETGIVEPAHPWADKLGIWEEDSTFDDFLQRMVAHRQTIAELDD